jgi:hypothetical protein
MCTKGISCDTIEKCCIKCGMTKVLDMRDSLAQSVETMEMMKNREY